MAELDDGDKLDTDIGVAVEFEGEDEDEESDGDEVLASHCAQATCHVLQLFQTEIWGCRLQWAGCCSALQSLVRTALDMLWFLTPTSSHMLVTPRHGPVHPVISVPHPCLCQRRVVAHLTTHKGLKQPDTRGVADMQQEPDEDDLEDDEDAAPADVAAAARAAGIDVRKEGAAAAGQDGADGQDGDAAMLNVQEMRRDAFWLQRRISRAMPDKEADAAQQLSESVFAALQVLLPLRAHQSCLVHDMRLLHRRLPQARIQSFARRR